MKEAPIGTRKCVYSSPYGGMWLEGYFHCWIETNEMDYLSGTTTKAVIEDAETGAIYRIAIGNFSFVHE